MLSFLVADQVIKKTPVSWGLYTLGQNTDFQQRLYASLLSDPSLPSSDIDRGNNSSVHDERLDSLDRHALLDALVKETLRLCHPVNDIVRTMDNANNDGTIIDGIFVPNGKTVRVPVLALPTRPEIWGTDALQFRPERWLTACTDRDVEKQRKWAMCAFWHGTHGCVGQRLAMLEVKAFLWEILRQFEIRPVPGLGPPMRRSVGGSYTGIKVHFVPHTEISVTSSATST